MNLYLRLIWLILSARRRPSVTPLGTGRIDLMVLPTDLDILGHMNNGRFLSVMDLGRVDLLVRTGFFTIARERGRYPLVGRVSIEYRKPLLPWRHYALETRIIGWDQRWFYLQQAFSLNGEVIAIAGVKAMIRSGRSPVSTSDALAAMDLPPASPEIPPSWLHLQERLAVVEATAS